MSFPETPRIAAPFPPNVVPLHEATVRLRPQDNIAIARRDLPPGTVLALETGQVAVRDPIPGGHKVALREIARGEPGACCVFRAFLRAHHCAVAGQWYNVR